MSGIFFIWTYQREHITHHSEHGRSYCDEYHLTISRGKQKTCIGSISLSKKLFGPTPIDFLKGLRRQLDTLYGNTDEFDVWNALYIQIHGEAGTRTEFDRLVSLYVACKEALGYWFPLLRFAIDDIPASPNISGYEWEQMKSRKQETIDSFIASKTFTQLVRLLLETYHRGILSRLIIFDDENS